MANFLFNSFKQKTQDGSIDLDTDEIRVILLTSAATPDQDTWEDYADITNEVVGTGYTAGGVALTTKTVTKDNTNNRGVFDADNVVWANSTITARWALTLKWTGVSTTSWLIGAIDFVTDKSSTAEDFRINWHADGIHYLG